MADSKLTALSEVSVPDFSDDIYLVDNTGPTSYKCGTDRLFGLGGFIPGGRLTTESGVGVSSSDRTAQGTLYYTPYIHNLIRVWDGTRWLYKTFSEISLSLTLTADKNYDVFVDDDAATLSLSAAWTNDSTRADALGTQDNVPVLNSDKTKLWLGTIRASGTNVTADSVQFRYISNVYNQVGRSLYFRDGTGHTYNSATIRSWNNVTTNRLHFILCRGASFVAGMTTSIKNGSTGIPNVYLALDWTSGTPAAATFMACAMGDGVVTTAVAAQWGGSVALTAAAGYHYLAPLEADFNNQTSTYDNHISSGIVWQ